MKMKRLQKNNESYTMDCTCDFYYCHELLYILLLLIIVQLATITEAKCEVSPEIRNGCGQSIFLKQTFATDM